MEKSNNNFSSTSHFINEEDLKATPLTHKSSNHLINLTTTSKKGNNDFNFKGSLNGILSDLVSLSNELSRVQKAKINSSIDSLKVIISRIPEDFLFPNKDKDSKNKDNSILNTTNNNNWLNTTQGNRESLSQTTNPFSSIAMSNGINRLSKHSGTIFYKSKLQQERRKSNIGEIKKQRKNYDDLDNSCNEETRNQIEYEKKMSELTDLRSTNKILNEIKQRLELEFKVVTDKNQDYKTKHKAMETALISLNKEYDELTQRYGRLQSDFEDLSNQKHFLHSVNENLKMQTYKNDICEVRKLKSIDEIEQLLRQSRDELNSVLRRESELLKDFEAKNKLTAILLTKLKSKDIRLNQIRDINKRLEAALIALIAKKEYFDGAVVKINEAAKSILEIEAINMRLEKENNQLKEKFQHISSENEKSQKQLKEALLKASSSSLNLKAELNQPPLKF